jgi:hypothetical protein
MESRELDALPADTVEIRRLQVRISVQRQIAITLIVAHDQQYIRPPGRLSEQGSGRRSGSGQESSPRL